MSRAAAIIWAWAASIILVWVVVAVDLGQPLWMRQHSMDLVSYGAFQGRDLELAEAWRLLASQWLHVKFPHMLFNALIIGLVGTALTRRMVWPLVLVLGLIGGAFGQLAAISLQPDAYMSGASQAYLALCGAALLLVDRKSIGWWAAAVGLIVSVGLDVFVADYGGAKPGHLASFVVGVIVGFALLFSNRYRSAGTLSRRL